LTLPIGYLTQIFRHAFLTPYSRVLKITLASNAVQLAAGALRLIRLVAIGGSSSVAVTAEPRYADVSTTGSRYLDVEE